MKKVRTRSPFCVLVVRIGGLLRLPLVEMSPRHTHLRTPHDSTCTDPELSLEPAVHLAVQRGGEEVEVEGEPHLARRREEGRGRVAVPAVPAEARGCAAGRGVHRPAVVVDAARVGPAGVAVEYAGEL